MGCPYFSGHIEWQRVTTQVPADFMTETDRQQGEYVRDPFGDIES